MSGVLVNPAAASQGTGLGRSFGDFMSSVNNSAIDAGKASLFGGPAAGLSSLIGSVVTGVGNLISQRHAANLSKELYDYQTDYGKLMARMTQAGINPGAAAQGLSGSTPSMPSQSGMPFPDLSGLGQLSLNAAANPSVIAKNEADALVNKARVAEIGQMVDWNPRRWQAEIDLAKKQADLFGSNASYYDELTDSVRQKRPWEIGQLQRGLQVMAAQISSYLASASMMEKQGEYYGELASGQKKINFINKIKASFWRDGINPDEPPLRSLFRLSIKNPKAAEGIINKELQFLGILDGKISESLGKNWKKYAIGAVAMHYLNNRMGEHASKKAARNADRMRTLMGLISVAGSIGTGSPAPAMLTAPYVFSQPTMTGTFGINDPIGQSYSFPFGANNLW